MFNHPTNDITAHPAPDVAHLQTLVDLHQDALDALPMSVVVYEAVTPSIFRLVTANRLVLQAGGLTIGQLLTDNITPEEARSTIARFQQCLTTNAPITIEEQYTLATGTIWLQSLYLPLPARPNQPRRVVHLGTNITERKQREQAEHEQQETIITHQAATLAELSTPLLSISDTTVVMPLIGTVDTRRVQHIMDALLTGVAERRAAHVILDITGVQVIDTQVANAFLRASQAVNLLGAQVILTGIRPEVAQTLVSLGVDLRSITTRSSLQSGIAYAMQNERRV